MKRVKQGQVAVAASIVLLISAPVFANGLTEHTQEMSVNFSYTDVDDVQTDTDLSLGWSYILEGGFVEVGGHLAYTEDDPEVGSSVDGTAIGPVVTVNFTPSREFSPYISARVGAIGGDLGDVYDYVVAASFGVSFFVGDSAALNVGIARTRLVGADGFQDQDATAASAGVSFFFGKRR